MKLSELMALSLETKPPREVWKAVEGDLTELIALLRSEKKLGRRTRDALADWLEGSLKPLNLPKGRPQKSIPPIFLVDGHDLTTELGDAGFKYDSLRSFIKKKGWHLKKAGQLFWSAERLSEAVAKRRGIEPQAFDNYLKRSKLKKPAQSKDWSEFKKDREDRLRLADALEIRRKKMRQKG